jgi:hypothetical protein
MDRYCLADAQWAKIEPLCLGKAADPGRTGGDGRMFLEAVAPTPAANANSSLFGAPFQRAHLEGVSRAAKAKTFGFELASHHFPGNLNSNRLAARTRWKREPGPRR